MAEYVALQLLRAFAGIVENATSSDQRNQSMLPNPLFKEAASALGRPSAVFDFAQDTGSQHTWPTCTPPEAPSGCGPPGHALVPGQDFIGGLRAEPSPKGWRWVDEARVAKQGQAPRPAWVKKFGLVAHGPLLPFDNSSVLARNSSLKLPRIAWDLNVTQGSVVVGYLRSFEDMGRAELFVDRHSVEVVDGLWADQSSQYSSVLLALKPGFHELEVVVLPMRSHDPLQEARGLNKFKLLEILVY